MAGNAPTRADGQGRGEVEGRWWWADRRSVNTKRVGRKIAWRGSNAAALASGQWRVGVGLCGGGGGGSGRVHADESSDARLSSRTRDGREGDSKSWVATRARVGNCDVPVGGGWKRGLERGDEKTGRRERWWVVVGGGVGGGGWVVWRGCYFCYFCLLVLLGGGRGGHGLKIREQESTLGHD